MGEPETLPSESDAGRALASGTELPVVDPSCYELGEELARGAFGRLIRARDRRLDREVAIKQLRASNAQLEARFRSEARITARLSHVAIVPVHEVGRWPSGEPFYAMKLVVGRSLRDVLDATPALADRLALVPSLIDVVDAVGYAHAEGVLHRDLKPGNIMIGSRRDAYLVDWGLAKERNASDDITAAEPDPDANATAAGTVIGTPPYLSPEQAQGRPVDERADVYSVGALLYEIIAGAAPYTGDAAAVLAAIAQGPPPALAARQPSSPRELVAIVERAMARDPAARYASGRELADDLRKFSRGDLVSAFRYSRPHRMRRWLRRHRAIVVAALGLVAAATTTAAWLRARSAPTPWKPAVRELESFEENSNGPSLSPDGTQITYDSDRGLDVMQAWVGPIDGPAHRVAPTSTFQTSVRFTDDGAGILFKSEDGIYRASLAGGAPVLVVPNAHYADDCAGRILAVRRERAGCDSCAEQLVIADAAGIHLRYQFDPVYEVETLRCDATGRRAVLYTEERTLSTTTATVLLLDLDGGDPNVLPAAGRGVDPTFHPDGKSIIYSSSRGGATNLWELPLDGGEPQQLTFGGGPDYGADIAPDGSRIAFDVDVTSTPLFVIDAGSTTPRRLTMSLDNVRWFSASRDGRSLVYQIAQRGGPPRMVVRSLESGDERTLADGSSPTFGPRDDTVYFARDDQVYVMPIAGGEMRVVAKLPGKVRAIFVDPDEIVHAIVLAKSGTAGWRIDRGGTPALESANHVIVLPAPAGGWTAAVASRQATELVPPGGTLGAPTNERFAHQFSYWDADGRSFLWMQAKTIYRHFLDTGRDEALVTLAVEPEWLIPAADGKSLYFSRRVGRVRRQLITNYGDRPRPK